MKKNRFLKFALAAGLAAALIPTAATVAFAEESPKETVYPSEFTHDLYKLLTDEISDYAVDGDNVAFAVGTELTALYEAADGERKLAKYTHESPITALDYSDGKLYMNTAVNVYTFSPETEEKRVEEHEFKAASFPITVEASCYYTYVNSEKELLYWSNDEYVSVGKGFTKIKNCGEDGIYALKENRLYKITGESSVEVSLEYTDFADAGNVYSGNTASTLKDCEYEVKIGKVTAGAFVTRIKDNAIGEKFERATESGSTKKSAGVPCLILAESGNASIIATNDGMFITATESITETPYSAHVDSRIDKHFYSLEDTGIYSRPYVSGATRIGTLKSGSSYTVKVTESFHLDYINTDFLRVTYTEDGEEKSGFVVANFLTEYNFKGEENEHEQLPYDKYDDKTNIVTVVVVVVIVALIIIAVLYLAAKMGKSRRKEKKKEKKKKQSDEDDED